LENTRISGDDDAVTFSQWIMDKGDVSLDQYCDELYKRTFGHPRSISKVLMQNFRREEPQPKYLISPDRVRHVIADFPRGVRLIYDAVKAGIEINLLEFVPGPINALKVPTFEYLATQLYAGYGMNKFKTSVYLPPLIVESLDQFYMPLLAYLRIYKSFDKYVDKSRVFEECILKWFQAVFEDKVQSWGVLANGFIPADSILFGIVGGIDPALRVDGRGLSRTKTRNPDDADRSFSTSELACTISRLTTHVMTHIYFPAPKSASPDIFIIPPDMNKRFLIGVAAKCYSEGSISSKVIMEEVEKFRVILKEDKHLSDNVSCVLIICSTAKVCGNQPAEKSRLMALEPKKHFEPIKEVLIMNLDTGEQRREFFSLGNTQNASEISMLIEGIIKYKQWEHSPGK